MRDTHALNRSHDDARQSRIVGGEEVAVLAGSRTRRRAGACGGGVEGEIRVLKYGMGSS